MDKTKSTIATYDKIAKSYTDSYFNSQVDLPYINKFISLLPKNSKLLDIGCGPGTITQYLVKRFKDVEGIDLSEEMIKIAKKKVPEAKFALMDMRKLNFPKDYFDGVILPYSLIHIANDEIVPTLESIYEIIKPNGLLMIITQKGNGEKVIPEPLNPNYKTFFNFFTLSQLNSYLKQTKFTVLFEEELPFIDAELLTEAMNYIIGKKAY